MLVKVSVLLVIGVFTDAIFSASIDCNIDECRWPMKIYEELHCKPIYGAKSCCPKRFECPENTLRFDANKCAFDDKFYKIGEVLNFSNESTCLETCICSRYDNEPAKFQCSTFDCGDDDKVKVDKLVGGCVKTYNGVQECCSASIVCDEDEKEKLATCWDESVSYREGEKFVSKSNPCYECICHGDFDNTTITESSPHCRKLNCDIELKYKSFVQRGCLPIFENDKCCPIDWKCPNEIIKKKIAKRDVDEIEIPVDDSSSSSSSSEEDNLSSEEILLETTTLDLLTLDSTTEQVQTYFSINRDPFVTPKESKEVTEEEKEEEEETSTEEQTKSLIEPEAVTEISTSPIIADAVESSTFKDIFATTELFKDDENIEDELRKILDEVTNSDTTIIIASDDKQETTESSNESSTTLQLLSDINDFIFPKSNLEESKVENSAETKLDDETTILTELDSENSATEEPEIETTTNFVEETSTTTQATTTMKSVNATQRTPKLVVKPSIHVIPPPSPTEFELLLTTLKEYVAKLENSLASKKASDADPPATFVNYTVSRSFIGEDNEQDDDDDEEKSISKRSAPSFDVIPRYLKHANKGKGCAYGKQHFKLGEQIRTDNECLECLCLYSPIGHCMKKKNCET